MGQRQDLETPETLTAEIQLFVDWFLGCPSRFTRNLWMDEFFLGWNQ
jgi:hypothetical protein